MEVHHHAHTPRKKWTHYFWEFLMLFLAVFCGFLAENQREHMVEQQREKQYIKSLKKDLETDINQINRLKTELHDFISRLDSIAEGLNQFDADGPSLATYKTISRDDLGFPDFIYTDRTMQQLKNAGGMRLIRNKQVADSIADYDAQVRRGMVLQDLINNLYIPRVIDKLNYVLNVTEINKLMAGNYTKEDTSNLKKNILLIHDKVELTRLVNEFRHYRHTIDLQIQYIGYDSEKASKLISLLQKEYHLK